MSQVLNSTSIDNTSSNITYSGGAWTQVSPTESYKNLYDNTESYSGETGATAILHFWGNALEYWGNTWNDHGPCNISIDSTYRTTITAYTDAPNGGPPEILFSTNDLTLGDHTFTLQVVGTNPDSSNCEIDRFVVNITSSDTSGSRSNNQSKSSTPIGAIVGSVAGCVVLLCIVAFLVFWRRNRRAKKEQTLNLLKSLHVSNMEMQRQPGYYDGAHPMPEYQYHALYPPTPIPFPAPASPSASASTSTRGNTGERHLTQEKAAYRRGDLTFSSASTNPSASVVTVNRVPEPPEDPPAYE